MQTYRTILGAKIASIDMDTGKLGDGF